MGSGARGEVVSVPKLNALLRREEGAPGRRASVSGAEQERMIERLIRHAGFAQSSDPCAGPLWDPHHYYTYQRCIGRGLFGQRLRPDFTVRGALGYPQGLAIESKAQHTSGTADEKFAYVVKQAEAGRYQGRHVILVAGGVGARLRAVEWASAQTHALEFMSLSEFIAWASRILRRDDVEPV